MKPIMNPLPAFQQHPQVEHRNDVMSSPQCGPTKREHSNRTVFSCQSCETKCAVNANKDISVVSVIYSIALNSTFTLLKISSYLLGNIRVIVDRDGSTYDGFRPFEYLHTKS